MAITVPIGAMSIIATKLSVSPCVQVVTTLDDHALIMNHNVGINI